MAFIGLFQQSFEKRWQRRKQKPELLSTLPVPNARKEHIHPRRTEGTTPRGWN
jgi:hypothetical protein